MRGQTPEQVREPAVQVFAGRIRRLFFDVAEASGQPVPVAGGGAEIAEDGVDVAPPGLRQGMSFFLPSAAAAGMALRRRCRAVSFLYAAPSRFIFWMAGRCFPLKRFQHSFPSASR
jgi:hypothetical protein